MSEQRSRAERSNGVAILASFLVIALGLAAALVVCTIAAPDPKFAIPAAIALFLLIAFLPFNALRERSKDASRVYVGGPGLFKRFKAWLTRPRGDDKPEPKSWKRRRTRGNWAPGSVFVPDDSEHNAPFKG